MCWYCYWGWPEPIAKIYKEALEKLGGYDSPLDYGPGHVVWADQNWDSAQWCLDHFDEYINPDHTEEDMKVARWALEELVKLDLEAIDPVPEGGNEDDNHVAYPPIRPVVKV